MAGTLLFGMGGDSAKAATYIARLLHGVTGAHMLHLQERSYARHMALAALYEGLDDLADTIAEEYMGCYSILEPFPTTFDPPGSDPIAYVQQLYDYTKGNRFIMGDDSHIQNSIDSVLTLLAGTLYKLKYLA